MSEACVGVLTTLRAFAECRPALDGPLAEATLAPIRAFFRASLEDRGAHAARVFALAGVERVVCTNVPFDAREASEFVGASCCVDADASAFADAEGAPRDDAEAAMFANALRVDALLAGDWAVVGDALENRGLERSTAHARAFLTAWARRYGAEYLMASTPADFRYGPADAPRKVGWPTATSLVDDVLVPVARALNLPLALKLGARRGMSPNLAPCGGGRPGRGVAMPFENAWSSGAGAVSRRRSGAGGARSNGSRAGPTPSQAATASWSRTARRSRSSAARTPTSNSSRRSSRGRTSATPRASLRRRAGAGTAATARTRDGGATWRRPPRPVRGPSARRTRSADDARDVRRRVPALERVSSRGLARRHEACVLAQKFRNLHLYGCWWYCNNPSIIAEITRLRLELLGTAFTAQHSDCRVLEQLVYKWKHSRAIVADALATQYEHLIRTGFVLSTAHIERDVASLLGGAYAAFLAK